MLKIKITQRACLFEPDTNLVVKEIDYSLQEDYSDEFKSFDLAEYKFT